MVVNPAWVKVHSAEDSIRKKIDWIQRQRYPGGVAFVFWMG
jgi:hypothetical protein